MKDVVGNLKTSKKEYPICFNLNVMEEIQDKYGSITKWGELVEETIDGEPRVKELKEGLMIMINEGIDLKNDDTDSKEPFVDAKQVGRIISEVGFATIVKIIMDLTKKSTETTSDEKNE